MNTRMVLLALWACAATAFAAEERPGLDPKAGDELRRILRESKDTNAQLRALWTLHVTGGLEARTTIENLRSPDEWIRAWTIQFSFESRENIERLVREANEQNLKADPDLYQLAETDPSAVVRLALASAAQRAPNDEVRTKLVTRLLKRSEDAGDHNIPLMVWFAMEPLVVSQPKEMFAAALETKFPRILEFTARRITSVGTPDARDLITTQLAAASAPSQQLAILTGVAAALKGQRSVPMPAGWNAVETKLAGSPNGDVRVLAQTLSLTFGSQNALASLRKTLADGSLPAAARRVALDALAGVKDAELPSLLRGLLQDRELRGPAIRALAGYNDAGTPSALLAAYPSLDASQKRDALNTLVARAAFAKPLLEAIAAGTIPAKDLTADILRQLRSMKDPEVAQLLTKAYGTFRETSADKKSEIEKYRKIYQAGYSQPGEAPRGRVLFNKVCAQCHTLFDSGGKVGPDITGANRSDLNYLLETIVDPNGVIPNEYRTTEIETKDGRSLTGIVKVMGDKAIQFQTANELLTLPRDEIESQRQTELSMMPEALLAPLSDQEVRDLLYYLSRPGQVPLPAQESGK